MSLFTCIPPQTRYLVYMEPELMSDALDNLHGCEADLADLYAESDALTVPKGAAARMLSGTSVHASTVYAWSKTSRRPVAAPYVAPVPAGFVPLFIRQHAALTADIGFLGVVAPDLFAWRVGGLSVTQHHATGAMQSVTDDQAAAAKARRHREYCDGLRIRPLPEAM